MTLKGKFWFGLGVLAFGFALFFILQEPSGNDRMFQKIDDQHKEQLRKGKEKYDSLQQEMDNLSLHYVNLQRSREALKQDNETLQFRYDKIKNRKPTVYSDAQIDSICAAWYGNPD
jgi:FtsZ-binding cell division protein ZapB